MNNVYVKNSEDMIECPQNSYIEQIKTFKGVKEKTNHQIE